MFGHLFILDIVSRWNRFVLDGEGNGDSMDVEEEQNLKKCVESLHVSINQ